MSATMKASKPLSERDESIKMLRKLLKPGATVYCILRHRSASGMSRLIDFCIIRDNEPRWISYHVGRILDLKRPRDKDGLRVGGCGMDMGFDVVYSLGRALFPKGFKVEGRGRNGDTSGHDNDGGYALQSRWL